MNLDELEAKARAATKGEWTQGMVSGRCLLDHKHGRGYCDYQYTIRCEEDFERRFVSIPPNITLIGSDDNGAILSEQNAAFIAAANPDAVLKLVTLAKAVRDWSQIRHRSAADDDKLYQALSALGAEP